MKLIILYFLYKANIFYVFDLDKKLIGLYKEGKDESGRKGKANVFIVIVLIILAIVVVGLVIFIIYYLKKPRKSRAFELNDDNFDYVPSN